MHRLSQATWSALRQAPRHGLGYEKIGRNQIRRSSIPPVITDDANIIAFRFHDMAPMVGFRGPDGTFFIVWFDRQMILYDHG